MKNINKENIIGKERVAKVLSRAGLCSRREAERWISEGKVKINNILIDTPATKVSKPVTAPAKFIVPVPCDVLVSFTLSFITSAIYSPMPCL